MAATVGDGHGSSVYARSDRGSKAATLAGTEVLSGLVAADYGDGYFAIDTRCTHSPGRIKCFIADLLPDHPIERDLLGKAVALNGFHSIAEAKTKAQTRGAAKALVMEMVARHVSPEGALFAVGVIAEVLKSPRTKTERRWASLERWWRMSSESDVIEINIPEVETIVCEADIETKVEELVTTFQFDTASIVA